VAVQQNDSGAATGVLVGNVASGSSLVASGPPAFNGVNQVQAVAISGDGSMVLFTSGGVTYALRMR
jgi:hypothetical protein